MTKHFFIDPFELTIAQWCHIKGKHNTQDACEFLARAAVLDEIKQSYRKYMETFEPENYDPDPDVEYDPLKDTRPWYYATYKSATEIL